MHTPTLRTGHSTVAALDNKDVNPDAPAAKVTRVNEKLTKKEVPSYYS
jgi:hypothetical protein